MTAITAPPRRRPVRSRCYQSKSSPTSPPTPTWLGPSTVGQPCHSASLWAPNVGLWTVPPDCYGTIYPIDPSQYPPAGSTFGYCNWWVNELHLDKPNLLILDEPTNHLDIDARNELLAALNDFDGAVVLVSHDRRLIEATADRLLLVADGQVKPFDGDLDDYRRYLLAAEPVPEPARVELKQTKEEGVSLLDRTMVFFSSNLADASKHSVKNMPVLLAGGGFKHGQHLAFDENKNPPLCNLFVSMLQRLGMETDKFASSTGTLSGLEMAG